MIILTRGKSKQTTEDMTMNDLVDDLLVLGFTLMQIKAALKDGAWLATTSIPEEEAEAAYANVLERIAQQTVEH